MIIKNESVVAEWSESQQQFHLIRFQKMLETNLTAFFEKRATSYIPIGIFDSMEEAEAFTRKLEKERQSD
jgi:hypothetical protein